MNLPYSLFPSPLLLSSLSTRPLVTGGPSAMGCTVSKRKPVPPGNGKQPDSNPSNSDKMSLKSTNSSGSGKKEVKDEKKGDVSEKPASITDISKLATEIEGKTNEPSGKKLKTLEDKTAKIPSIDLSADEKKSLEKDAIGKTPSSELPCATPLKDGQKLQPPKPDNGEYINFNDVLSDEFSEDDDKDDKKEKKKSGKKEEKKKEGKKEEKKEKEKEKEKPKDQKDTKTAAALSTAPKQEKPKTNPKSVRSVDGKGEKKNKDEGKEVRKTDGMKIHETKDAVKKMRTGVRSRHAPHEDTLYQVPHRMPECDFTKLH